VTLEFTVFFVIISVLLDVIRASNSLFLGVFILMRLKSTHFVVAFALLFVGGRAHADSLRDVVYGALKTNPSVSGAYQGKQAAEHGKEAEISHYYPEVSAGVTGGRVYQDNSTSRGLVTERGAAYSGYGEGNLSVRQMLFDGLETANRVKAADARLESEVYGLMDTEESVISKTVTSYIEVMRLRSALSLLRKQASHVREYQERILGLVEDGGADDSQLQQARDVSMVVDGLVADYEGRLYTANAMFHEATGQMPPEHLELPESVREHINENVADVVKNASDTHPKIMALKLESNAARHDMKAEQSKMYPDVMGELSYFKSDKKDVIGGENKDARAVVKMNWNFSTGGREFSKFRQKQSEHHQAQKRAEEMERELERMIYQSYARYRTLQKKYQLSADRVDLNEKLVSAYQSQFEGSRISLLNLMRAESQLFKAKLERSDNAYNLLASEYGVLASIGTLKDVILSLPTDDRIRPVTEGEDYSQ